MENDIEVTFCSGFLVIGMDLDGVGYPNSHKLIFSSILVWWTTKLRLLPRTFARLVINKSGSIQHFVTREGDPRWLSLGKVPRNLCITATNGAFGECQHQNYTKFEYTCPIWVPTESCEWSLRHACGRCVRKCGQASICKSGDGFVKVENVPLVVTMTTIVRTNKRSKVSSWPQFSSSIPNVVAEFHVL